MVGSIELGRIEPAILKSYVNWIRRSLKTNQVAFILSPPLIPIFGIYHLLET
jgi:hypothetical protein